MEKERKYYTNEEKLSLVRRTFFDLLFSMQRDSKRICKRDRLRLLIKWRINKKKFFSFFTLTPSLFAWNALFIGVSVVRVSVRANLLPSHFPSHFPSPPRTLTPSLFGQKACCLPEILWMGVRFNRQGAKKQRFTGSAAMLHLWCSYAATVGATMLPLWYSYARSFIKVLYCRSTPIGLLQYLHWITPVLL